MQTFCTIITAEYLPFANALFSSLNLSDNNTYFCLLIVDEKEVAILEPNEKFKIYRTISLMDSPQAKAIYKKYAATNTHEFRWAMKPVFISYLLENGFNKVIFTDADIFFVSQYDFLFELLDNYSVLLTPHWNNTDPVLFEERLVFILRNGLFNGGFVAASQKGLPAINWWAEACHYKMDRQPELGIYHDQKYLDVLPVQYPDVCILRHRGCNIASWNMDTSKRTMVNGQLKINGVYDPVFIHFTKDTINHILNANDYLLRPYLDQYISAFTQQGYQLQDLLTTVEFNKKYTLTKKINRRLLLRTRLKRWLLRLSQKL